MQATLGLPQGWLDIETISSKSLLCSSSSGRNSYGLLFLNFIIINFIGLHIRADTVLMPALTASPIVTGNFRTTRMTKMLFLFFIINLTNQAIGQTAITVDTLLKNNNVKTKTQYECDKTGQKCKPLYQHQYDVHGRLTKYIEFSGSEPFLTAFYHYNSFNKADTVFRQFSGQRKYVSQVYLFDANGNVIEYQSCFENSGCSTTEKYSYDKANRIATKIEFRNENPDTKTLYIYNEIGDNIKIVTQYLTYQSERIELNDFDEKHQKIKSISYGQDKNAMDSTTYSYDNYGNLLSLNWMGGLGTKSLYTYDTEGNVIEYRSVALGDQINDRRVMTYINKLVQTRIHYEKQSVKYFFKFDYEFY